MSYQHKELASGRWSQLSFLEQMANIGSEVERALSWRAKGNAAYSQKAVDRALELMDLTLQAATTFPRRRELARVREAVVDFFLGSNEYRSSDQAWRKYFFNFTYALRKKH